jgi:hypothetical protein
MPAQPQKNFQQPVPGRASDTQSVPHLLKTIENLKGVLDEKVSRPHNINQAYVNRTSGSNSNSIVQNPKGNQNESLYNYQYPNPSTNIGRSTTTNLSSYQYSG